MTYRKPVVGNENHNNVLDLGGNRSTSPYVANPDVHGSNAGFGVRQVIGQPGGTSVEFFEVLDAIPEWYVRQQDVLQATDAASVQISTEGSEDATRLRTAGTGVENVTLRYEGPVGSYEDGFYTGIELGVLGLPIPFSNNGTFRIVRLAINVDDSDERAGNVASAYSVKVGDQIFETGRDVITIDRVYSADGTATGNLLIDGHTQAQGAARLFTSANFSNFFLSNGQEVDNLTTTEAAGIENARVTVSRPNPPIRPITYTN